MKLFVVLTVFILLFAGYACWGSTINAPTFSGNPPVIDGKMDPGEWDGASAAPVCLTSNGDLASPRGRFYVGRSAGNLYLAFVTDSMLRMPVAKALKRDGNLWEDDAVEFYLKADSYTYQVIVNSSGVIYDNRSGDAAWNGPWKAAVSTIGSEWAVGYAGGETPKRGFIVELMLPLDQLGVKIPTDGDVWGFRAIFDMVGANPQAVWQRMDNLDFKTSGFGKLVFGGPPNRLEEIKLDEDGRLVKLTGTFGEYTGCSVGEVGGGTPNNVALWGGPIVEPIKLPGGSRYIIEAKNTDHYLFGFPVVAKLSIPVLACPIPSRESFYISCDPVKVSPEDRKLIRLSIARDNNTLWTGSIDLPKLTMRNDQYISYKGWGAGPVQLVVSKDEAGKSVELGRISLKVPSYVPAWTKFVMPKTPAVPKPWVPVNAEKNVVKVWGREYSFGKSPFLDQVNVLGASVLASPVTMRGMVDGKNISWKVTSWKLISRADEKAVYEGKATAGALNIDVRTTIEFDGAIRLDWKLSPVNGAHKVRDLAFVVPVKPQVGKSMVWYGTEGYSFNDQTTWGRGLDVPKKNWTSLFTPSVWIGDQSRGIDWFADHRGNWTPADVKKAVEVSNTPKAVELILHIADKDRVIDKPLDFTFGLLATPTKQRPSPDDFTDDRTIATLNTFGLKTPVTTAPMIFIPRSDEDARPEGCIETDARVDWDPENPASNEKTAAIFEIHDSGGTNITDVEYLPSSKTLRVTHSSPEFGWLVIGEGKIDLKKGEWHRFSYNWGPNSSVYVDGKLIVTGEDKSPIAAWENNYSLYRVGCSGRWSLKGWRISYKQRSMDEVQPAVAWKEDANTQHLELLEYDPTPMNWTNPRIWSPRNPGYLVGNWTYDSKNRILIAGQYANFSTQAENLAKMGFRGGILWNWSNNILGNDGPLDRKLFEESNALCNKFGIRTLPYMTYGITNFSPDFEDYKWELSPVGPAEDIIVGWRESGQISYTIPLVGSGAKRSLYSIDEAMRLGAGGVYFDGAFPPDNSTNPIQGYESPVDPLTGGKLQVWHWWDRREYMKNVYKLLKYYRNDAVIDCHATNGFGSIPTLSFATCASNGESLGVIKDWENWVSPQAIRAEIHGRQFGFNVDALMYVNRPVPPEYGMSLMAVHGQNPRTMWGLFSPRAAGLFKLSDKFNTKTAQWMPYYHPEKNAFKPTAKEVFASAFVHPGKRTLLLIANLSDTARTDTIRIDWKKLGLKPTSTVIIYNWNGSVPVKNNTISLRFNARQVLYVWIGGQ